MQYYLFLMINGLAQGSIYALVALGFVIIYKATKVVNFAQGEMLMVGAYICCSLTVQYHLPFLVAFFMTLGFSIILGLLLERLVLRPMIGEPIISVIMVTVGLTYVLKAIVQLAWPGVQTFPPVLSLDPVIIGGLPVAKVYIAAFSIAVVLFIFLSLFFKFSRWGLAMRATAFSQMTAASMGISIKHIFALSWCISAVVSSVGGVVLGNLNSFDHNMAHVGLMAFPAVILGGLDSLLGAAIGGLFIGVLEKLCQGAAKQFFNLDGFSGVAAFIFLVLILMIRPYGLFGTEEIERV